MSETIVIESLSKSFNASKDLRFTTKKNTIINDLSLRIAEGEVFGFIGPNGAGKSTLINLIMGFIAQDNGTITINGISSKNMSCHSMIGYLPEDPRFYLQLNAKEHLLFAGKASGLDRREIDKKTNTLLGQLLLQHAIKQSVNTYSKGMKQRLGIAMAMIHDPLMYILDEPMSGLDPMGRRLVADIILELKNKGKTVFFSSHILNDIETLCDRIAILNKGNILYCGPVSELETTEPTLEKAFIKIVQLDNHTRQAA